MLVLSRKKLQSIQIGDDIKVTVVKIEGNQVRLGIEAPRGVTILRSELVLDLPADDRTDATAAAAPLRHRLVSVG